VNRGVRLREVAVRLVRTDAFAAPAPEARAREFLADEEIRALERLRPAAARRDYLAAHFLARVLLGEVSGVDPALVRLRAAPGGKPEFEAPPGVPPLRFSLSHADGIALCAAAEGCEVGADVEGLRNLGPDPLAAAEVVCSEEERAVLEGLPPADRAARLLLLWTAKEAIAKATGRGLRLPLPLVTVLADRGGAAVEFAPGAGEGPEGWRIELGRPTPVHAAAVAVRLAPGEKAAFRFAG